jgi:predicted metalloenzyme YecM
MDFLYDGLSDEELADIMVVMTTFLSWGDIRKQEESFGVRVHGALTTLGILEQCKDLSICHACVRIKNPDNVTELKENVSEVGKIISSAIVNGREILIIQLDIPLTVGGWSVYGIELPYPKQNHSYEDGLEHVEFVLSGIENTMDAVREKVLAIMKDVPLEALKQKYSYSEDEPQAEGDQKPNPTISIKVDGIGIKFHALSIQDVVGFRLLH